MARRATAQQVVALLRGINLGARNRIGMAELRAMLGELGLEDVRTHLQSGNVLARTRDAPGAVAAAIEAALAERLGLTVPVVSRTGDELARVVASDPFGDEAPDGSRYVVVFLSGAPHAAALEALRTADLGTERAHVSGGEAYVWCPDGVRTSTALRLLTDRRLGVTATARNWNTVTRLAEMVARPA